MKQRIITGVCLIVGAVIALGIGGLFLKVILAIALGLGLYELTKIVCTTPSTKIVEGYVLAAGLLIYLSSPTQLLVPSAYLYLFFVGLLMCMVLIEEFTFDKVMMLGFMASLVITGIRGIVTIRSLHSIKHIVYLFLATFGCDTGAYFAGYFFGKHKLIERLSPKKTIEGSIGGILAGTLLATLWALVTKMNMPFIHIVALAFVLTITSQFGDLSFSALKRYYGFKDFSNLLPGHGGVLDRVDSLIINVVVYTCWFVFFL